MDRTLQLPTLDIESVPGDQHANETPLHGATASVSPTASSSVNVPVRMSANNVGAALPDRHNFETEVWRYNNDISNVHRNMSSYWTEQRRQEAVTLKTDKVRLKKEFDALLADHNALKKTLDDAQARMRENKNDLTSLEDTDLGYRDTEQAKTKLAALEQRFAKTKITNVRDEQIFVNEITRLKRNIVKLKAYEPVLAKFKESEAECKELRKQLRLAKETVWIARDAYKKVKQREHKLHEPIRKANKLLSVYKAQKKVLIEKYEQDRKCYTQWLNAHPAVRGLSSFPSAMLSNDEDELEPFYKQKNICHRLISYLKQLLVASEDSELISKDLLAEVTEAASQVCEQQPQHRSRQFSVESDDSADDYPASFQHMNLNDNPVGSDVKIASMMRGKRIQKQKTLKKQHMPITHNIAFYRLFGEVEVNPPKTYGEVAAARASVEKVLHFFEEQTCTIDRKISPRSPWSALSNSGSEFFGSPCFSPNSVSTTSLLMSPVTESVDGSSIGDESPNNSHRASSAHRYVLFGFLF